MEAYKYVAGENDLALTVTTVKASATPDSVKFAGDKAAGTLKEELARKAYGIMREDPEATVKATVKAGRYPGSFELLGIQS